METPSSTRRVTRSQTRTRNGKQQQERSALVDITNDSPIVGLAMETPSSAIAKQRAKNMTMTPGSGEALLRGQVKTLLQKVEEEAELSKVPLESRPFLHLQGCVNSPMGLLAPTPANTPQVSDISEENGGVNNSGLDSKVMALPVVEDQLKISEGMSCMFDGMEQEVSIESQKSLITRSLLLDFSEKSESSDSSECCSVVIDQGVITGESSACKEKSFPDDDNASIWSIQVSASSYYEDDETIEEMGEDYHEEEEMGEDYHEEEEMGDAYYEEEEEEEEEEEADGGLVDELCEGLSKISMKEMFRGKHTRFVYNSEDEIEEVEDIIRLKGLPTPKGKHLRFPLLEEDH